MVNEGLTLHWCNEVLGIFSFCKGLIVWDSFECEVHLTDNDKETLIPKLKLIIHDCH